jgi:catechol 2,3-dioxygenase-like lactoylglutathione lyase family enzyme
MASLPRPASLVTPIDMILNQVTLPSRDVARGADFYRLLGFVQIVDAPPRYVRFEIPDGLATLSLELFEEPPAGPRPVIFFECEDVDATVEELRARGVAFDQGPRDQDWLWREARLHDPDGNELCLFHAGENRRFPPWRIGRGAIPRLLPASSRCR